MPATPVNTVDAGDGGSADRGARDDPARGASAARRDPGRRHAGEVLAHEGGRADPGAPAGEHTDEVLAEYGYSPPTSRRSGPRRSSCSAGRVESAQRGRIVIRRLASATMLALLLTLGSPLLADAVLYRWTDAEGTIHYTTDPDSIPPAFRGAVREIDTPTPGPVMVPAPVPAPAPSGVVVPYSGGPVIVDASLNGVAVRLLLDTGADRTLISPDAMSRAGFDTTRGTPVQIRGVTGDAQAVLVSVPRLDVAGTRVGAGGGHRPRAVHRGRRRLARPRRAGRVHGHGRQRLPPRDARSALNQPPGNHPGVTSAGRNGVGECSEYRAEVPGRRASSSNILTRWVRFLTSSLAGGPRPRRKTWRNWPSSARHRCCCAPRLRPGLTGATLGKGDGT